MFKVDLHVHTVLGGDSLIEPDDLVPLAREAGLDAVCVTEHHAYDLSRPFDEVSRRTGFPIFRGFEYTAFEGHLLIFGVNAGRGDLPPRLPLQRAVDWTLARGGVAIAAHPYQRVTTSGVLGDRVLSLSGMVAIETLNASATSEENRLAALAAARLNLPGTGGSDAHGPSVLGRAYTMFPSALRSEEELVEALRAGGSRACWANGQAAPTSRP